MSSYDVKDLPPIVHYLQVIILGCDKEAEFKAQFNQIMSPENARIKAMQMNTMPDSPREKAQVEDAYRTAIRIWKAGRALGMTFKETQRLDPDILIMAGL